ncbi:MAG: thiamine pyrophosphate-binding protein [Chloroflexi bacterium]|nr:thiamine pyrophosphate-binding protein [Chloroflexota bacterium]
MPRMTGGQALSQSLYREGVRTIFGLPGVQIMHALDALYGESGIRFLTTRHEQGTTYMADGFARTGGGIGIALVVPGIGIYNAAGGVATAYAASSPVFLVAGHINRDFIGRQRGVLHEVEDQLETIAPVTKWRASIRDPRDIPGAIHEAMRQLRSGRPRPVAVDIPPETLAEEAEITLLEPEYPPRRAGDPDLIDRAARLLAQASSPLIWAGGGVNLGDAAHELTHVAEYLQAPVITTPEGKGAISDRHPLALGAAYNATSPLQAMLAQADMVLAVGTRLATAILAEPQQVIQIDVDPEELGRNYPHTLGIAGDARLTLALLRERLQAHTPPRPSRSAECEAIRNQVAGSIRQRLQPQAGIVEAIRAALPEDGILVPDMTQIGYACHLYYPVYQPRTYLTSSYMGNLGYAFPTALGAKVANPDRAVVVVSGDGGFLYNSQELATAVQYGINVVVIVFDDHAYGNVLRDQQARFGGRALGSELHNPGFARLAQAYGADGIKVNGPEDVGPALAEALRNTRPTLIEVPVGPMPSPFVLPTVEPREQDAPRSR